MAARAGPVSVSRGPTPTATGVGGLYMLNSNPICYFWLSPGVELAWSERIQTELFLGDSWFGVRVELIYVELH